MTVLTTNRLTLRDVGAGDASFVASLLISPEARRYLGGPVAAPQIPDHLERTLGASARGYCWIGVHKDTRIGLFYLSPHHDTKQMELSFVLHPQATGQGYATEACQHLCTHAFGTLGLPALVAETQVANTKAQALLARLGFAVHDRFTRFGAAQVLYRKDRQLPPPAKRRSHPS